MTENSRQALVGVFAGTHMTLAISDIDELSVIWPAGAIEEFLR